MDIVIMQKLSNQSNEIHVITRLVDKETGEVLGETRETYTEHHIDDVVSLSQMQARRQATEMGASRFAYDLRIS